MKTVSLAIAAVSLLQLTSAQPHRRRHAHEQKHQNVKKDAVVVTVVDTVYAEASEVPEVIVYVDQNGDPFSTTTELITVTPTAWGTSQPTTLVPSYTPAPASSSSASSSSSSSSSSTTPVAAPAENPTPSTSVGNVQVEVASSASTTPAAPVENPTSSTPVENVPVEATSSTSTTPVGAAEPATTEAQVEAAQVTTTPAAQADVAPVTTTSAAPVETSAASSSSSSTKEGSGFGLAYSPYNADGTCKTQDQVNDDFAAIGDYSLIRTYGTDCNQVATVLAAATAKGMKLFAGIFDLSTLSSEIAIIVSAANGDWSGFDTISIGNELVNSGTASASAVVAAIGTARGLLTSAGYTGRVVTVDTLVAARANPSLCDASDYCAVNCHPFFDGTYTASESGKFLTDMIPTLSAVLSNPHQEIVITETGWPWQGDSNGVAVPSLADQAAAISSITATFSSSPNTIILFTAFNDMWKTNSAAQYDAEQFWGLSGAYSPSG